MQRGLVPRDIFLCTACERRGPGPTEGVIRVQLPSLLRRTITPCELLRVDTESIGEGNSLLFYYSHRMPSEKQSGRPKTGLW